MSAIAKSLPFPNLFFRRPDGTSFELVDFRKKEHLLVLLVEEPEEETLAFLGLFHDRAKLFEWMNTRLVAAFPVVDAVATPWPAPAYPASLHSDPLPEGLAWGRAYVVSKHGTLLEVYSNLSELSVEKVERDILYWEAGHCLP